jgi:hypothetical protein
MAYEWLKWLARNTSPSDRSRWCHSVLLCIPTGPSRSARRLLDRSLEPCRGDSGSVPGPSGGTCNQHKSASGLSSCLRLFPHCCCSYPRLREATRGCGDYGNNYKHAVYESQQDVYTEGNKKGARRPLGVANTTYFFVFCGSLLSVGVGGCKPCRADVTIRSTLSRTSAWTSSVR